MSNPADEEQLKSYRAELHAFRQEYGGARAMPAIPFFQFGMGSRTKLVYRNGVLREAPGGAAIRRWNVRQEVILPHNYTVSITTSDGVRARITEDEDAVWIEENGRRRALDGTNRPLKLPSFVERHYTSILRVLHHEILINILSGAPVPNYHVYRKPWYRDGAMMALCLQKTGNLNLIEPWIRGLQEPFDRNNAGEMEADNPGQALFLLSLVADKSHPLVPTLLEALKRLEFQTDASRHIKGRSDFADHPVYQTKWAKFGLRALSLPDPYTIPSVRDSYSSLFWMDYREQHVPGGEATDRNLYPYLGWATDHFQGVKKSPISDQDYPLTWEIRASQADYEGMRIIDPVFVDQKTAAPHTWHAAEVFLWLLDSGPAGLASGKGK